MTETPKWAEELANQLLREAPMDKPFWRVMADAVADERSRCAGVARNVRKRMEAGRKRALPQIEEYGAGIGDDIADRIEAGE